MNDNNFKSGYSEINGLNMYYEIYGEGKPLVLLHGGGSTLPAKGARRLSAYIKNMIKVRRC